MVREMVVIVQEQETRDRIGAQVPRAFLRIQRREGMVRVLQARPVHGEGGVTQRPARQREIQRQEQQHLESERSQQLRTHYRAVHALRGRQRGQWR